ncbi:hypothetical protein ACFC25_17280 [Pseudarthrobacter sp. NPDC055928]|uniref:hypothetical protein n=1 Tax=Pseudarthrobacter sp. NPDC055928 TaxID=3345661 RepID=UPI0035D97239
MPQPRVSGVELYYDENGNGVLVVGLHGTPVSAAIWEDAGKGLVLLGGSDSCT